MTKYILWHGGYKFNKIFDTLEEAKVAATPIGKTYLDRCQETGHLKEILVPPHWARKVNRDGDIRYNYEATFTCSFLPKPWTKHVGYYYIKEIEM